MLIRSGMPVQAIQPAQRLLPQDSTAPVLDQIVNNPAFDTTTQYTQSETSICVNGNNMVESFNDSTGDSSSGYAFSSDGGKTWTHDRIPQNDNQLTLGDGVVALGPKGEVYYSTLMFIRGKTLLSTVGVAKSMDHGATFTTPVEASTSDSSEKNFNDKEWIAVDRSPNSPFNGSVYVSWTNIGKHVSIDFARSTDQGATFSDPNRIATADLPNYAQGSNIAIGPAGDVHVVYFVGSLFTQSGSIAYVKSTDGGRHFSSPIVIANMLPIREVTGIGNVRANSLPDIAVGPNGAIHVAYDAQPALGGKDRSDIFYVRSTDGGTSFSQPVRLNDDSTNNSQLFPSVAVTAAGAVGIEWWDRRNSTNDCLTDVYMTISHDGGTSFGPNFRVTNQNFVFTPIEPSLASGYHGDYLNMTADGETFFPSWSSEARGNPDAYMGIVPAATDPLAPDFGLAAQKVYDAVSPGGSADYPLSIESTGGFSGDLTFAAYPQIAGVTVSLNRQGSSQLLTAHVDTSADTPAGSYLYTVTASSGPKTRATEFWVNILAKSDQLVRPFANASNTPGYTTMSTRPQVDPSGNLHVAFNDDSDSVEFGNKVFYTRSSDGGRTYSPPIPVSRDGQDAGTPIIAVGSAGNVFIAWLYSKLESVGGLTLPRPVSIAVSRSSDSGVTFSPPVDISTNPGAVSSLVGLNQDSQGGLDVLYLGSAGSGSQSLQGLLAVRSLDFGQTFPDPVAISSTGQQPEFISIAADKNGALLVIYLDESGFAKTSQTPIFACRSTDGHTFSQPVQISPSDVVNPINGPILELGADGSAYVLYETFTATSDPLDPNVTDLSSPSLSLLVAPDGKTFSLAGHIPTQGFQPSMLVGPSGRIYVSFVGLQDLPSGGPIITVLITRSEDKGASFSIPIPATSSDTSAEEIVMIADQHGNLNVGWSDFGLGASTDVFMAGSVDGGVTFSTPLNVSANVGVSLSPFLALLADGNLAVLWNDDSAENPEVFSAVLAPPAPATPDFAPVSQSVSVARGFTGNFVLSISRPGGFSGSVSVTAPSTLPQGVHISPPQVSTTTTNAGFTLAVDKKHLKPGSRDLEFTATDGSGRTKSATITLDIQ
jgi:hypothetical protein